MAVTLDGTVFDEADFADYGYLSQFPTPIFTAMLAELANVFNIAILVERQPYGGEVLYRWAAPRALAFLVALAGSVARAATAATAETVFSVQKNGVEFGTVTFAAAGTTGTFASAAGSTFAAGDILTIVAPATADATIADVMFTLIAGTA